MVEIGGEAQLVQRFAELAGDEQHVIALAARGHDLAHDFFIGGMDGHFGLDAGFLGEILQQILRHIAVPIGDDDLAIGQGRAAQRRHDARKPQIPMSS